MGVVCGHREATEPGGRLRIEERCSPNDVSEAASRGDLLPRPAEQRTSASFFAVLIILRLVHQLRQLPPAPQHSTMAFAQNLGRFVGA